MFQWRIKIELSERYPKTDFYKGNFNFTVEIFLIEMGLGIPFYKGRGASDKDAKC